MKHSSDSRRAEAECERAITSKMSHQPTRLRSFAYAGVQYPRSPQAGSCNGLSLVSSLQCFRSYGSDEESCFSSHASMAAAAAASSAAATAKGLVGPSSQG